MQFAVDHDYHLHSNLSRCSRCPEQTPERILQYAQENGLKTIVLTDHFWDCDVPSEKKFYEYQNFEHITQSLPLPQAEGIRFLFGCETDLDKDLTLGISRERMEALDFIIIPTTHFHMQFTLTDAQRQDVAGRISAWLRRLEGVLNMDLPFYKVGLAHLTCSLIHRDREEYLKVLAGLPEDAMAALFQKAARCGVGIELNASDIRAATGAEEIVLRPYRIAKECGCKFYMGSDSHSPDGFLNTIERFEHAVTVLELTEDDKFIPRNQA